MALALRLPLFIAIVAVGTSLPPLQPTVLAAGLDANSKATLKEATRLYKQGQYEEAAKLLTELAVDHPEMTNLQRNLGACYYYMRRPEPALSNLRDYLAHKKNDITADDKQEVERWIDEMEKLRAQNAAVPVALPLAAERPRGPQPHLDGPPALQPSGAAALPPPTPAPQPPISPSPGAPVPSPPALQPTEPKIVAPFQPGAQQQPSPLTAQESVVSAGQQVGGTTKGSGLRIAGIACGALGLASIGTAIYYYTRATSLSNKVTSMNPASSSDYQAGKDAETMQWVFYSVGAGVLATGAALYLLGYSQGTPAQVGLAPILGPRTAGLSARGGF
jgi:tetratricopeptide (TPR) repeat protein